MRAALLVLAALAASFAGITWWALEAGDVAVIETRGPEGAVKITHVWFVDADGQRWLEAGTPENGWFRDVQTDPALVLHSDGGTTRYVATPQDDAVRRAWLRARLREKYGFRDRWVGLLVDASRSIPVRLEPAASTRAP